MTGTHYADTSTWGMALREQGCQAWVVEALYVGLWAEVSYVGVAKPVGLSLKLPGVRLNHNAPPSLPATS